MGASPFQASVNNGAIAFPDFVFENMGERDLLSLHVDDFWGVPWDYCNASGCSNLPAAWVAQWQALAAQAKASGKVLYLAVSPLTNRRALAARVLPDGSRQENWNTAVDANGCYLFATDPSAASYQAAYLSYVRYLVALVGPQYLSPAVEINIPFASCPAQKAAWISWYSGLHAALKSSYPTLPVFPTFQMEFLYGQASPLAACAVSLTYSQCFDQHLAEALTVPGDRIAFSTYPSGWKYSPAFNYSWPTDTYARVKAASSRTIWISETGWPAVPVLQSYAHGSQGSCGASLLPATLAIPGGTSVDFADDQAQSDYLAWLLAQAQADGFEAVVWWLNRDYLDGAVAATCPCVPSSSGTCTLASTFWTLGGDSGELNLRVFGNMGLRNYDGSARPGDAIWQAQAAKSYTP